MNDRLTWRDGVLSNEHAKQRMGLERDEHGRTRRIFSEAWWPAESEPVYGVTPGGVGVLELALPVEGTSRIELETGRGRVVAAEVPPEQAEPVRIHLPGRRRKRSAAGQR